MTVDNELNFSRLISGETADEIAADGEANDITRLHIHNASRGANRPVVYGIFDPDTDSNDIKWIKGC